MVISPTIILPNGHMADRHYAESNTAQIKFTLSDRARQRGLTLLKPGGLWGVDVLQTAACVGMEGRTGYRATQNRGIQEQKFGFGMIDSSLQNV